MTEKHCLFCKYDHPPHDCVAYEYPCCECENHSHFEEYKPHPDALQVLQDVKQYLLGVLKTWEKLPDQIKYELVNIQVANHTRKELYALEAYAEKYGFKI